MTAPALYRYVGSYQELVDLVAFEIDKAATDEFRAAAATQPDDDPMAQLVCASVAFRRWALGDHAEFSMVFANPVAESHCHRREIITAWTSGPLLPRAAARAVARRPTSPTPTSTTSTRWSPRRCATRCSRST